MNCYFCHTCDKEFFLNKDSLPDPILCTTCGLEFVEEIEMTGNAEPVAKEVDSETGNEFLSCKSEEAQDNEDDWEDEPEENADAQQDYEQNPQNSQTFTDANGNQHTVQVQTANIVINQTISGSANDENLQAQINQILNQTGTRTQNIGGANGARVTTQMGSGMVNGLPTNVVVADFSGQQMNQQLGDIGHLLNQIGQIGGQNSQTNQNISDMERGTNAAASSAQPTQQVNPEVSAGIQVDLQDQNQQMPQESSLTNPSKEHGNIEDVIMDQALLDHEAEEQKQSNDEIGNRRLQDMGKESSQNEDWEDEDEQADQSNQKTEEQIQAKTQEEGQTQRKANKPKMKKMKPRRPIGFDRGVRSGAQRRNLNVRYDHGEDEVQQENIVLNLNGIPSNEQLSSIVNSFINQQAPNNQSRSNRNQRFRTRGRRQNQNLQSQTQNIADQIQQQISQLTNQQQPQQQNQNSNLNPNLINLNPNNYSANINQQVNFGAANGNQPNLGSLFSGLVGNAQNIGQQINISIDSGNIENQIPNLLGNILGGAGLVGANGAQEEGGIGNILQQSINEFMNSAQATDGTPASKEFLDGLRQIRGFDMRDVKDCQVCFEKFSDEDYINKLPCKHLYHSGCIGPWFQTHDTCPVCREVMPKK